MRYSRCVLIAAVGLVLAVGGCKGGGGTNGFPAEWWMGALGNGGRTVSIVVGHDSCDHYDHAQFANRGSAIQVTVFNVSTSTVCDNSLYYTTVTLTLPHATSAVVGGCIAGVNTPDERECGILESEWTHKPAPG